MKKILVIVLMFVILSSSFSLIVTSRRLDVSDHRDLEAGLFDRKINFLLKIGHFPSLSACIVRNDSVVWYEGYGYSNINKKEEPSMDTIYQLGSISKSVTAVAVLQLFERGFFMLDDDINDYVDFNLRNPHFPDVPITIRMLLAHRASFQPNILRQHLFLYVVGLSDWPSYPYPFIREVLTPDSELYNENAWLDDVMPGTSTYYSCYDYIVLEHLVEVITNQSFECYCQENVLLPLKMHNTSFFWKDLSDRKIAIPYEFFLGRFFRIPAIDLLSGVGGLKSNVEDLSHYLIAHMNYGIWKNARILNETTTRVMRDILGVNYRGSYGYGLGWQERHVIIFNMSMGGHQGVAPGGFAWMFMNSSRDIGIIMFFNKYPMTIFEFLVARLIFFEIIDKALKI
jgi:CubicO group peptidase (beta-lactamase class C family)